MRKLIGLLFDCRHYNTSRVWTMKVGKKKHSYLVCMDCGREIPYDLKKMEVA